MYIALSFTLKGQDQDAIIKEIKALALVYPNTILVHGFMPRKLVIEKGFSTAIVDALEENFPIQLNLYDNGPLRKEMASLISQMNGFVVIIGEIKEGVEEEKLFYKNAGITRFISISLN